ncbi:MAG: NADPH:quinone reductase [Rhodospirillaceae bacterium]
MHVFSYDKAGPAADVLKQAEWPDPEPGPGEVRVRVAYSAVNPTDVKRRSSGRELSRFSPIIPNNDGSGVIDRVGDGVSQSRVGQRVWIFGAQHGRPHGTAAEYVVLPQRQAVNLPGDVTLSDGACAGVPVVTAWNALFADGNISGKTILVTGGTGRVGAYAVQLGAWAGATMIATCGSDANCAEAKQLGAAHALNYREPDLAKRIVEAAGGRVDRIVDVAFGVNIGVATDILKVNGVISTYASEGEAMPTIDFFQLMQHNLNIRMFSIYGLPTTTLDEIFFEVSPVLSEDTLVHRVGERFAFDDMVKSHEAVEQGAVHGVAQVLINKDLEHQ